MRGSVLATFIVIVSLAPARAEESPPPRERTENFFQTLAKGSVGPAFDLLFAGSPIPVQKPQAVDALKRQTEAVIPVYGKMLDAELVAEKPVGKSLILLIYVQRLELHPLVWRFWYYKPHDRWYLSTVFFNDQLQGLPE